MVNMPTGWVIWDPTRSPGLKYWACACHPDCTNCQEPLHCELSRPNPSNRCDIHIEAPVKEEGGTECYAGCTNCHVPEGCTIKRPPVENNCDIHIEAPVRIEGETDWLDGLIDICGCRCAQGGDCSKCGKSNTKDKNGNLIQNYDGLGFDERQKRKIKCVYDTWPHGNCLHPEKPGETPPTQLKILKIIETKPYS